jgi:hypothetical protein
MMAFTPLRIRLKKAVDEFLSKFFNKIAYMKRVWRQILGRELANLSPQNAKFLPEICGQTPQDFQSIENQGVTKTKKNRPVLSIILNFLR